MAIETLGLRAAARALQMRHSYLSRLAKEGKVPRQDDGTFDVQAVRKAITAQTDPALVRRAHVVSEVVTKPGTSDHPGLVTTPDQALEAINLIVRVLRQEGVLIDGVDFPAARLAETILKARDRDLRIAERRKMLVPLAAVRDHIGKAFVAFRQAIQRMPSRYAAAMAAELGCDVAALTAALDKMIAETLGEMSAPAVRS